MIWHLQFFLLVFNTSRNEIFASQSFNKISYTLINVLFRIITEFNYHNKPFLKKNFFYLNHTLHLIQIRDVCQNISIMLTATIEICHNILCQKIFFAAI